MHASSAPDRRGFALGSVLGVLLFLSVVAFGLHFVTSSTQANVARAVSGRAHLDLCLSAQHEVQSMLRSAITFRQPFQGRKLHDQLGEKFPFEPFEVEPATTRKLAAEVYPGATVSSVKVRIVGRDLPGGEDPLLGVIEMTVSSTGRLAGAYSGRELRHRVIFVVPCAAQTLTSEAGVYQSIHWGTPFLQSTPISERVTRL
jgi:hypothetical protein